jgi:hypothetical protein
MPAARTSLRKSLTFTFGVLTEPSFLGNEITAGKFVERKKKN